MGLKKAGSWCESVKLDKGDSRVVRRYSSRISMAKSPENIKLHAM